MMKDKYQEKLCQQLNLLDHMWSKPHLYNYVGRNQSDLKVMPARMAQDDRQLCESQSIRMMTRTQTGTEIKSPARYS